MSCFHNNWYWYNCQPSIIRFLSKIYHFNTGSKEISCSIILTKKKLYYYSRPGFAKKKIINMVDLNQKNVIVNSFFCHWFYISLWCYSMYYILKSENNAIILAFKGHNFLVKHIVCSTETCTFIVFLIKNSNM